MGYEESSACTLNLKWKSRLMCDSAYDADGQLIDDSAVDLGSLALSDGGEKSTITVKSVCDANNDQNAIVISRMLSIFSVIVATGVTFVCVTIPDRVRKGYTKTILMTSVLLWVTWLVFYSMVDFSNLTGDLEVTVVGGSVSYMIGATGYIFTLFSAPRK